MQKLKSILIKSSNYETWWTTTCDSLRIQLIVDIRRPRVKFQLCEHCRICHKNSRNTEFKSPITPLIPTFAAFAFNRFIIEKECSYYLNSNDDNTESARFIQTNRGYWKRVELLLRLIKLSISLCYLVGRYLIV